MVNSILVENRKDMIHDGATYDSSTMKADYENT